MTELVKITQQELSDKLISGLDDTPEFSVSSMQARFDAHPNKNTEVINQHAAAQNQNNSDFEKRITENRTAVLKKVDKVAGKGLSESDFTAIEKTKLSGIEDNANNYVLPVSSFGVLGGVKPGYGVEVLSDGTLNGLAAPAPDFFARDQIDLHKQDKSNPHNVTAEQVGAYSKSECDLKFAEKLKSHLIIYVSPQGSNTLGDGTQGKPYKTITYALSTVPKVMNDFRVTINLAQGTYAENVYISGFVGANAYNGIIIQGGSSLADSVNYKVNCVGISNVSNKVDINGIKTMSFSTGSKCTVFASKAFINNCDFTEGTCAYGILCGYGMSGVQINNCTISNTSFAAIMSSDNSILSVRNVSGSNNATGLCAGSSSAATGGIIMKGSNISLGATTAEAKFYGGQIFG